MLVIRNLVAEADRLAQPAILITLVLLAAAVRIPHLLDSPSFDEVKTLPHIEAGLVRIWTVYDAGNNHPLYNLMARMCWLVWPALWSVRLPALISALLTIGLLT